MTGDHAEPRLPATAPLNLIDVSAGLVFRNGLLLITQRRLADHLGGLWEFPGGKRHPPESDQDCLKRELREEIGIEVEVGDLMECITHEYPEKAVRLKFFRCRWTAHEPRALACQAFAWINSGELSNYAFPPADAKLLQALVSNPEFWH